MISLLTSSSCSVSRRQGGGQSGEGNCDTRKCGDYRATSDQWNEREFFATQSLNLRGNGIENRADIAVELRAVYV